MIGLASARRVWLIGTLVLIAFPASAFAQAPSDLSRCWEDLASEDAGRAYRAAWQLAQDPAAAVKLFRRHLAPAPAPNQKQMRGWVADLENPTFAIRDKAFKELQKRGELAEELLNKALAGVPELETRRRVELLLERLHTTVASPEKLRLIRAMAALEAIGDVPAKELLAELAKGFSQDRLTREAQASLQRLDQRGPIPERWLASPQDSAAGQESLPPGARLRLGTTLFRLENVARSVHFSPDSRLVICHDQLGIYLWHADTGKLARKFDLPVECLAVAPKGTLAVLGVRGTNGREGAVVWWDWQAGKVMRRAEVSLVPRQVGITPDGKQVIARDNQNMRFWDAESRQELKVWNSAKNELYGFSPDGSHVVVSSANGLDLLNLQTKAKVPVQGAQRNVSSVGFSSDGKLLTLFDYDSAGGRVWDVATGTVIWRLPKGDLMRFRACFSPDGKLLVANGKKEFGLWELSTGKFLKTLSVVSGMDNIPYAAGSAGSLDAVSPDGRWLASAIGNSIKVCRLDSGAAVETGAGHASEIKMLEFSPRLDWIATSHDSDAVRFWDPLTCAPKGSVQTDILWMRGLCFSPDGRLAAAAQILPNAGWVGVWETKSGRQVYKLPGHAVRHYGRFTALRFSPDNRFLLSWGDDFYLRKWDLQTGKAVMERRAMPAGATDPDDEKRQRLNERALLGFGSEADAVFTPRADQLLVLGNGGALQCFDVASGKPTRTFPLGNSIGMVGSLAMSATGAHVAAMVVERDTGLKLHVCSLASGKPLFNIPVPGSQGHACFSPDGRTVAAAGGAKVVLVEVATGKIVLEIRAPSRRAAFSPDGRFLATAMPDTTALVWDLASLATATRKP